MQNIIFSGIFDTSMTTVIAPFDFLLCMGTALMAGFFLALVYTYKNKYTKSFVITLALLPAVVCVVIMMVNGNIGVGVAVAGAFSLVRFRSIPGTAKEIGFIFMAMGTGLVSGMGYLAYAILFTVVLCIIFFVYNISNFGVNKNSNAEKSLRITIPEDLDYTDVFDDLMKDYTSYYDVINVKTTNMGSLFKLTYNIALKDITKEKEFIDKLRCRNGNLEISISKQETNVSEL